MEALERVYPSQEDTVFVEHTDDTYGGAHAYAFRESLGHQDGKPVYTNTVQRITFCKKGQDGSMCGGLQSEQLLIALIDRHKKLNAAFPSEENEELIWHLEAALTYMELRVRNRIKRGVMGELKK